MRATRYEAPDSIDAAIALLAAAGGRGRVLAGGTDLLVQLHTGRRDTELVVDVKHIDRLTQISHDANGYRIGAAVCGAELGEHAALKAAWPGVVESMELVGSTQIQGRASLGGNLCNASPAADSVPALIAASARCVVAGPGGEREVDVADIATGPGETSLEDDEILVELILPEPPAHCGDAYLRLIPRTEMDIAVVGAGACLTLDSDGQCTAARVALGAVAPTVRLIESAADILVGTAVDDAALARLDEAARATTSPIDDMRGTIVYRTRVAGVLARRATAIARDRARSR